MRIITIKAGGGHSDSLRIARVIRVALENDPKMKCQVAVYDDELGPYEKCERKAAIQAVCKKHHTSITGVKILIRIKSERL